MNANTNSETGDTTKTPANAKARAMAHDRGMDQTQRRHRRSFGPKRATSADPKGQTRNQTHAATHNASRR
ncbi:hypothetical protein Aph02nite_55620 [Actinoplanes philippinensis]|nr:hypothetical protein Aph02nite_55620 [Actinoplanes philippinensis]